MRRLSRLLASVLIILGVLFASQVAAHADDSREFATFAMGDGDVSYTVERHAVTQNPDAIETYNGASNPRLVVYGRDFCSAGSAKVNCVATFRLIAGEKVEEQAFAASSYTTMAVLDTSPDLLFLYNRSTGAAKLQELRSDGTLGADVTKTLLGSTNVGAGWTSAEGYKFDSTARARLLLYNATTGAFREDTVGNSGSWKRDSSRTGTLPRGFTSAKPYYSNPPGIAVGRPHLVLLSSTTGDVQVRRSNSTSWDTVTYTSRWTTGWTTVEPYFNVDRDRDQLFLLKESNGDVHINDLTPEGRVSTRTYDSDWKSGWRAATFWREQRPCGSSCVADTVYSLMLRN